MFFPQPQPHQAREQVLSRLLPQGTWPSTDRPHLLCPRPRALWEFQTKLLKTSHRLLHQQVHHPLTRQTKQRENRLPRHHAFICHLRPKVFSTDSTPPVWCKERDVQSFQVLQYFRQGKRLMSTALSNCQPKACHHRSQRLPSEPIVRALCRPPQYADQVSRAQFWCRRAKYRAAVEGRNQ